MAYKIAIAGGKGGTGKTTVSLGLLHAFKKYVSANLQLVDCDVEEPNDALFFKKARSQWQKDVFQLVPKINVNDCTFCKRCVEYCEFNAIVMIPSVQFIEVNSALCHSCGACSVACVDNAIDEIEVSVGEINCYQLFEGVSLLEGRLRIGSAMQTFLIHEMKKMVSNEKEMVLYDVPPGTSCSVVASVEDVDFVVLVTEPTPFGLHDLKLIIELLRNLGKEFGVVINKAGIGNRDIYNYLTEEGIVLLGEIPFSKAFAVDYAVGKSHDLPSDVQNAFEIIVENIVSLSTVHEGNLYFKW